MDVYDIVPAHSLEGGEQILVTRIIKREPVKIAFIVNEDGVIQEGDTVALTGEPLDKHTNGMLCLHPDEDVELWSI